jgi:hypothetical protein
MIRVSNGTVIKEFSSLQQILKYFGESEGRAIIEDQHSEYSMMMVEEDLDEYPEDDDDYSDLFYD